MFTRGTVSAPLLVLGLICSASSGVAQSPDGLRLHLDFETLSVDGGVPDVSGGRADARQYNLTNNITQTNGIFGGRAASFTYVGYMSNDPPHVYRLSQYLGVTNVAGFEYLTNGTISFWAQFGANRDLAMLVLDTGYTPNYTPNPAISSNSWTIGRAIDPYLSFTVFTSAGGRTIVRWPNDVVRSGGSNPDLSTTRFNLYTLTFDCARRQAVAYYNGRPYQTNFLNVPWLRIYGGHALRWLSVGAMAHAGTPFWGDDRYPNSGFFVGRLDDVRIYDRVLSPSEISDLYLGVPQGVAGFVKNVEAFDVSRLRISWQGMAGQMYQPEFRSNSVSSAWVPLGPAVPGGEETYFEDSMRASAGFFRVRAIP